MSQDEEAFRQEVLRVMQAGPTSSGDNLLGMEIDFNVYLAGLNALEESSVAVRQTGSAETLLLAECDAASGVPVEEAAEAVRRAWLECLCYGFQEAHYLDVSSGGAVLRFITQIGPSEFYVTGQVVIRSRGK